MALSVSRYGAESPPAAAPAWGDVHQPQPAARPAVSPGPAAVHGGCAPQPVPLQPQQQPDAPADPGPTAPAPSSAAATAAAAATTAAAAPGIHLGCPADFFRLRGAC